MKVIIEWEYDSDIHKLERAILDTNLESINTKDSK